MGTRSKTLAALLAFSFAAISLLAGCSANSPATRISAVPQLAGLTPQEARDRLQEAGLTLGELHEAYTDAVPPGKIISTLPAPGEELEEGSSIDATVSKGPEMVTVPALLKSAEADATASLQSQGLQPEVRHACNESVAAGLVCAMEPAPNTAALRGSKVTLTVSQGSAYTTCGTCEGNGTVTTTVACPECGGSGVCYT